MSAAATTPRLARARAQARQASARGDVHAAIESLFANLEQGDDARDVEMSGYIIATG